jgi:hypothetical protein
VFSLSRLRAAFLFFLPVGFTGRLMPIFKRDIFRMKTRIIFILSAVAMGTSVHAQGTITFYNNNVINPITGVTYVAGIWDDRNPSVDDGPHTVDPNNVTGYIGAGTTPGGITVGLFLASNLTTAIATTTLRTTTRSEVFVGTQDITIPGTTPGQPADLVIRAWSTTAGSYGNARVTNGAKFGEAAFMSKPLGGINPNPPPPSFPAPDIAPFPGLEMDTKIPEPSMIALSVLGLGGLIAARRRK